MRKKILFIVVPIVIGAIFAAFSFGRFYQLNSYGETKTVIIPPGVGVKGTLSQLHREGLVPPMAVIALPLLLTTDYHSLKAGEYELYSADSPANIIDKIIRGEIVIHKFTIPEGWNSFQVRSALMSEPLLTGEVPFIPEGSLLPDTILFQRGQSRASIVEQMQKRMREMLEKEWAMREKWLPLTSPQEAITLASIVEKETGVADERAAIAGVFYNRLRLGMRLQSDPTVAYGIEIMQDGTPLDRTLTTNDLKRDTPYNTYTRMGLPPEPICNPGLAAIRATLHPATTNALFFVATGQGGHAFSETLAEHNNHVARYRATLQRP
jgi:UPF0755 protein